MTAAPAVRRLPVPDTAPPLEVVSGPVGPPWNHGRRPAPSGVQGTLRLVVGSGTDADALVEAPDEDDFGPVPTSRADLPDPQLWSRRLVQVLLEVMTGHRAASQLLRWTTTEVYERVRAQRSPLPRPGTREALRRPVVRTVRVCEPADGVAEVSAVITGARRVQALAVRLEGHDGRWRATALECG